MRKTLFKFFVAATLYSCGSAPTSFFELKETRYESGEVNGMMETIRMNFVVRNVPKDMGLQMSTFLRFIMENKELELTKAHQVFFAFYRESRRTPIDYKENTRDYFNIDRIEDHIEDLVISIEFRSGRPYEYISFEDGNIKKISRFSGNTSFDFD